MTVLLFKSVKVKMIMKVKIELSKNNVGSSLASRTKIKKPNVNSKCMTQQKNKNRLIKTMIKL